MLKYDGKVKVIKFKWQTGGCEGVGTVHIYKFNLENFQIKGK